MSYRLFRHHCAVVCLVILCLVTSTATVASADVSPGDVVDRTNWKKVNGMIPAPMLDWVKGGDITLKVGALKYDPSDYIPPKHKRSLESNRGKYDLNGEDLIIETATGERPKFIEGVPFPVIDENDPNAGTKIMYNKFYANYVQGNHKFPFGTIWVGRSRGFEREVNCEWQQYPLDGYPGHKDVPNREDYERFSLILVLSPFDIAGTNILLMRYRGLEPDSTLAYVPAIRRVRRMSPANRSDSFIGSDACVDDAWLFDGKVTAFNWKVLPKREALLPFLDENPQPLEEGSMGSFWTGKNMKQIKYGYEDKAWQGAPWHPTNLVWVKRQAYVIEMTPKDPYYNYGTQHIWVDSEMNMIAAYKVIQDRAKNYWKVMWYSYSGYESQDGAIRLISGGSMIAVDDRSNHGTIIRFPEPNNNWGFFANLDRGNYTLSGFQRLCR